MEDSGVLKFLMEENKKSKYSSGLNIIIRIDYLWKNCQGFKRQGRYSDWNDELDTIWLELARDIPPDKYNDKIVEEKIIKGYASLFKEFDMELKNILPFMDYGTGFGNINSEIIKNRGKQYTILMKKHEFLTRLENEYGKGTTYEEEDDDF